MRRTAIVIMLVGFVFTSFSVTVFGIDLLIDAVGYLLVWNGLRALHKKERQFGYGPACCLLLVAVCAVQLFAVGMLATVLAAVRLVAEGLLYWRMLVGFVRLARSERLESDAQLAIGAFGLCEVRVLTGLLGFLISAPWYAFFSTIVYYAAIAALLVALVRFAFAFADG